MLQDVSFRASKSRREMLRFIVEETLAGREDRLKGVTLAFEVLGRDETFDQQSDPVVRIEARRLRTDLDSYYVDAGNKDPVRITIPKGGYVPHFAWQNREARAPALSPEPHPQDAPSQLTHALRQPRPMRRLRIEPSRKRLMLVAAVIVLGGLAAIGSAVVGVRGADPEVATARTPALIVLPFEAFGDTADIELIAAGVTEELIGNLMLFKNFRVYSAASSFRLDAGADPATLGRDLGVSFVVSGVMQAQNGAGASSCPARRRADRRGPLERQLRRTACARRSAWGATRSGGGDLDRTG